VRVLNVSSKAISEAAQKDPCKPSLQYIDSQENFGIKELTMQDKKGTGGMHDKK
jgi:hypothetical protein